MKSKFLEYMLFDIIICQTLTLPAINRHCCKLLRQSNVLIWVFCADQSWVLIQTVHLTLSQPMYLYGFLMIVTTKLEIYISNSSNVDYQYEVMGKKNQKTNEVCNYRVPGWDFILATALRLEENLLTSLDSSYLFCEMEQ